MAFQVYNIVPAHQSNTPSIVALMAGTGGITDVNYLNNRQEWGYKLPFFICLTTYSFLEIHQPIKDLERILQIMKPSISELASLFGVSRQTIYNWQAGEIPSSENAAKIEELAKTADFLAAEGVASHLLQRKFTKNCSLFDLIREGESSYRAAQLLVNILRKEAKQREILDKHLAGRKPPAQNYSDYAAPILDEKE